MSSMFPRITGYALSGESGYDYAARRVQETGRPYVLTEVGCVFWAEARNMRHLEPGLYYVVRPERSARDKRARRSDATVRRVQ